MKLVWDESAWADYVWWQAQDRKVLKRINQLIADIQRNGNEGIGKPEPLTASCTRSPTTRSASPPAGTTTSADRESGARAASRHFPAISAVLHGRAG